MKLPEEVELVWDDSVAPETCIDFEAPHVDTSDVLKGMLGGALFFAGLFGYVVWSDPEGSNPVATRSSVIPFDGLRRENGFEEAEDTEESE